MITENQLEFLRVAGKLDSIARVGMQAFIDYVDLDTVDNELHRAELENIIAMFREADAEYQNYTKREG